MSTEPNKPAEADEAPQIHLPENPTPHTDEVTVETEAESKASESAMNMAAILFAFFSIFTGLLSASYFSTQPAIEASAMAEKLDKIREVLPAAYYNNDLLSDTVLLETAPELGQSTQTVIYRARLNGAPAAIVTEATAPDGYSGRIRLLLAISNNGKLLGVRVIEHKETPGLGDYIDPRKDKNRDHPWISQFSDLELATLTDSQWKVRKDGGDFNYHTGATVSPRAIVKAIHRAEMFIRAHQQGWFAESGQKGTQP